MTYQTIAEAFYFVSGAQGGEHLAVIKRSTGETFYRSDLADIDEFPDDVDESDDYVAIPDKNDLDLGKRLVMDFVRLRCPEEMDQVRAIFSRRGAYARYKYLLNEKNLLEQWHAFENERTKEALLEWCKDMDLVLEDASDPQ